MPTLKYWDSTLGEYVPIGTTGGGGAGVSDHGELAGLADDDHTQYAMVTISTEAPVAAPTRDGILWVQVEA